jgi:hypothetical protein
MKAQTLPNQTRGRKWLMISIANLILQTLASLMLYSMFGMIGLAAVIYFQAFLILAAGYYYQDPQPNQRKEV